MLVAAKKVGLFKFKFEQVDFCEWPFQTLIIAGDEKMSKFKRGQLPESSPLLRRGPQSDRGNH